MYELASRSTLKRIKKQTVRWRWIVNFHPTRFLTA